ncbi:sigma factor-like helix-turn-helix DNA-binding protein [Catenuloplanes atrovinosus]|uniref:RNA polymerase sigma-70 factor (ECF subfamily) n=1 Tax=Catenuloplanes atrovinosus TaxID=137266 RepID=A0AAE3YIE9_9ACTN|nr:sigma factor-like helix-turn-helix DNA-binding protein [Catenuloplanes atrovinosus]MDR7274478.1 RNA polymerase sigma-70 factor (ECF subfamily) [Catenuloplanes atrovinosus]
MDQRTATQPAAERHAGFDEFYRGEFLPLTRTLMLTGAGRAEAEDAAQEAMRTALQQWARIDHPPAFVRTVALRALWRGRSRTGREIAGTADRPVWADGTEFEFDADTRYVLGLLGALSAEQRTVMALRVDQYSTTEIAAITGQPPATVRSNLRHARRRLARMLDPAMLGEARRREVERWRTTSTSRSTG